MIRLALLPILLASLLFLTGCSEEPGTVGMNLLPADMRDSKIDTLLVSSGSSFEFRTPNGSGTTILAGQQGSLRAIGLLSFLADRIPDTVKQNQIIHGAIFITLGYSWTPSAAPQRFIVRKITKAWSNATVTSDSLSANDFSNDTCATLIDTLTMGRTIALRIDSTWMKQWLAGNPDSTKLYGFAIETDQNSGIWGFEALSYYAVSPARISVNYNKNSLLSFFDSYVYEDAFIVRSTQVVPPQRMVVQGGISARTKISFPLPAPAQGKSIILHSAQMELTLDKSASLLGYGTPDTVVAQIAASNDSTKLNPDLYAFGFRIPSADTTNITYAFSSPYMRTIIQMWMNYPSVNFGFVLMAYTDAYSVDKFVFYSAQASLNSQKPRMVLTYTIK